MMLAFRELIEPAERASAPLRRSLMTVGSVDAEVVPLLAEAEVVPPWDLPALRHLSQDEGYGTLPIALRRELIGAGWERLTHDRYLGVLTNADGTSWSVFLALNGRRPAVKLVLRNADLATFGVLAERGHYVESLNDGGSSSGRCSPRTTSSA